ncbi:MAG TPA: TPM domain-containing protein, partial [Candidatus Limnocylindria bacterium]|nr:TPM domain-containing protein [Candidatus Limnocylindria bacterium]
MPTVRRSLPALLAAIAIAALVVGPVLAETLSDRVVDETGLLSEAQLNEAKQAIGQLESNDNIQLWALFVNSTGGTEVTTYADGVASENGLGGNDALLV